MVDLNEIDLEGLPNVDNRLIPQLRKYFSRVMKLHGNPLDYRIQTIYNELKNGDLEILVSSKDSNSPDYYEEFPKEGIGLFVNKPSKKEKVEGKITKDVSRIFIDESQIDTEYISRFSGYEDATISHEMEHFISDRFDGRDHENDLCNYLIIGEPATEIGSLYNSFYGDEKKIKKTILEEDNRVLDIGYLLRVRFLWAINEATGHNIVDLIEANRNNDFDYFCSIIPETYIGKISLLYEDFFEGKCIDEIGNRPARVLYDAIEQLKNYMYDNLELYPNLTNQTIDMIDSIFEGYERIIEEKNDICQQLGERCIFNVRDIEEEELKEIVTKMCTKFPESSEDEMEYSIFGELLRQNPYDKKANVIMSCYSGYFKYLESIKKVRENIGQEDFIVRDNFEDFLYEYRYKDGFPTKETSALEQESIYRELETGRIKCFINGNEVSEDGYFSIFLEEDDEIYGNCIKLAGKVVNEDEWEKLSKLILSNGYYKYVPASTILDKMKDFKEALRCYSFDKKEKLSDEAYDFLDQFYYNEAILKEEEYASEEEIKVADIARNALMSKSSELNFASYTSVNCADEEFKRRTEYSKDEGERI